MPAARTTSGRRLDRRLAGQDQERRDRGETAVSTTTRPKARETRRPSEIPMSARLGPWPAVATLMDVRPKSPAYAPRSDAPAQQA